jgi:nifR3 family TIM-barrel protein
MADVTDIAFRQIIAKYSEHGATHGGPDVFYTEFVSADGLLSPGREVLLKDLAMNENEHPIVAQLFTAFPDHMEHAAALVAELGFDGIDINMGCPDRNIEKQGCGAALMKNPALARELIRAAKRGAHGLPVSVKTRVGYNKRDLDTWIPELLAESPEALIVHARTRKEMSKVPAQWEDIARVAEMARMSGTIIVGNGDVESLADGEAKARASGADGVMVGRGIFGNPWFFNHKRSIEDVSLNERLRVMVEHTQAFEDRLPHKNFAIMKKHYKAYVHGFDGAKELRMELMDAAGAAEVAERVAVFLKSGEK